MRYLLTTLACLACSGAIATTPLLPPQRDGTWLQNGIKQYHRWGGPQALSDKDTNEATSVTSYICGVVDLEEYLVQRAAQLSRAVQAGKKRQHLDPRLLDGMSRALPMLIPLMDTEFSTDPPPCDRAIIIVWEYMEKYPEMIPKDADVIVERALLDAYTEPK
jgi:hypothetical protein